MSCSEERCKYTQKSSNSMTENAKITQIEANLFTFSLNHILNPTLTLCIFLKKLHLIISQLASARCQNRVVEHSG